MFLRYASVRLMVFEGLERHAQRLVDLPEDGFNGVDCIE